MYDSTVDQSKQSSVVRLEKSTAQTAWVDEHFSYKQAHTSRFSIVFKSFYRQIYPVPKVQYPPTCFHCLLHVPNHPSLGPLLRPSLPIDQCPHLRSSLLAISHCFGGLESLKTCSLACTPAVRAWRPITPAFKTTTSLDHATWNTYMSGFVNSSCDFFSILQ